MCAPGAWPFLAPPGVPADRVDALRKAFMATMQDKDFLAEAAQQGVEVRPVEGAYLQNLLGEVYTTPKEISEKAAALMSGKR